MCFGHEARGGEVSKLPVSRAAVSLKVWRGSFWWMEGLWELEQTVPALCEMVRIIGHYFLIQVYLDDIMGCLSAIVYFFILVFNYKQGD